MSNSVTTGNEKSLTAHEDPYYGLGNVISDGFRPRLVFGQVQSGWIPPARIPDDFDMARLNNAIATAKGSLKPADRQDMVLSLTKLKFLAVNTSGEVKSTFKMFCERMGDIPLDILNEVTEQWILHNKFFPAVSEFIELCRPQLSKRRIELERLEVLLRVANNPCPHPDGVTSEWLDTVMAGGKRRGGLSRISGCF